MVNYSEFELLAEPSMPTKITAFERSDPLRMAHISSRFQSNGKVYLLSVCPSGEIKLKLVDQLGFMTTQATIKKDFPDGFDLNLLLQEFPTVIDGWVRELFLLSNEVCDG